jgi:cobyrinic acid a,c-diamide synthase
MKAIIVAAPMSGSGKTTITLGLMECLKRRGLKVAPFKVGPDFIDPGYHRLVTGRASINLDAWMCSTDFVRQTFARYSADADIAVIEGVMGLFDGISGRSDEGSTAQIARLIGAPVLLVLDAKGLARSAAAMVKGFAEFDPDVRVAGVIFNNVASENHARLLREAVETSLPHVRVLGCIPRDERLLIPSRHLGLMTVEENPLPGEFLDYLVEVVRAFVDLGMFWVAATPTESSSSPAPAKTRRKPARKGVRLGVARDAAFCFVYDNNLRLLAEAGAELVEFSPLADGALPPDLGGVYLPGGYPEIFAEALAANSGMKAALRTAINAGLPVYAECGGFIYLSQGVVGQAETGDILHEFVGIFPATTRMLPRRKALGYREVEIRVDSPIGPKGLVARGHEFHYSEMAELPPTVERLYRVSKGQSELGTEGYRYKNCLASYIHLHFGSNPQLATAFVENCRKFKDK